MVRNQGHPTSLLTLVSLVPVLLLICPARCQAQTIVQFWYADINDVLDPSKADVKFPSGKYGIVVPAKPGEIPDATTYGNAIRGATVPPATNMEYLKWDPAEADKAKTKAEKCDSSPGGSNEIVVTSLTPMTYTEALDKIRLECKTRNDLCSKPCLQYSMLMTAGVNKFGCASAHCPDTAQPYRVHCLLEPNAALTGRSCSKPYDSDGVPCEKCPREKGYCHNNLCVSHQDKSDIAGGTPGATFTCSAPCRNCGVRKDEKNECFCKCESGTSGAACHMGSLTTSGTCGACALEGKSCLNNGIDSGEKNCQCLCPYEFVGPRCEFPRNQGGGGTRVIITGRPTPPCQGKDCKDMIPGIGEVTGPILNDIKIALADQVNKFCKKDQLNYIKCCGVGTLPTSGPTDFVTPDNIKISESLIGYTAEGKAEAPIQVVAPGNNGLCRKKTRDPTLKVPIPNDVLAVVMQSSLNPCCNGVKVDYQKPVPIAGLSTTINIMSVTIS